jgi:hypothetical protein
MYMGDYIHSSTILDLTLDEGECSASRTGRFIPEEISPGNRWIGVWVSHRIGLYAVEKRIILPCRKLNPALRRIVEPKN